jgi:Ubiquitin family
VNSIICIDKSSDFGETLPPRNFVPKGINVGSLKLKLFQLVLSSAPHFVQEIVSVESDANIYAKAGEETEDTVVERKIVASQIEPCEERAAGEDADVKVEHLKAIVEHEIVSVESDANMSAMVDEETKDAMVERKTAIDSQIAPCKEREAEEDADQKVKDLKAMIEESNYCTTIPREEGRGKTFGYNDKALVNILAIFLAIFVFGAVVTFVSMIAASCVADFAAAAVVGINISVGTFVTWISTFSTFSFIDSCSFSIDIVHAVEFVTLLFVGTSVETCDLSANDILLNLCIWISLMVIGAVLSIVVLFIASWFICGCRPIFRSRYHFVDRKALEQWIIYSCCYWLQHTRSCACGACGSHSPRSGINQQKICGLGPFECTRCLLSIRSTQGELYVSRFLKLTYNMNLSCGERGLQLMHHELASEILCPIMQEPSDTAPEILHSFVVVFGDVASFNCWKQNDIYTLKNVITQFFVRAPWGITLCLQLPLFCGTGGMVKQLIFERTSIDPENQALSYGSKMIEHNQRLQELGVRENSTLYLYVYEMYGLKGGAGPNKRKVEQEIICLSGKRQRIDVIIDETTETVHTIKDPEAAQFKVETSAQNIAADEDFTEHNCIPAKVIVEAEANQEVQDHEKIDVSGDGDINAHLLTAKHKYH